jgi:hypothetical protein
MVYISLNSKTRQHILVMHSLNYQYQFLDLEADVASGSDEEDFRDNEGKNQSS